MSQIRVKFATPLLHPKRSTTAKPPVQLNGPDLDSPHRTSQTYTVENLFGQIATAETPVLKEMLIAKRPNLERRGRPYDEVFENLPNTREARDSGEAAASSSMPHPKKSDEVYTFPLSPVIEASVVKQKSRKKQQKADRQLFLFVRKTLGEIQEIRKKRKILREQGFDALKKYSGKKVL